MSTLKRKLPVWIGVISLAFTLASGANAFIGECEFALDNETLGELSDKHVIRVKDGSFHRPLTVAARRGEGAKG